MDHAAKLLTAYAARFPLEFEKQYFSNLLSGSLCCAAEIAVAADDPAALTLLKKIHLYNMSFSESDWLIAYTGFFRRKDCLIYCLKNIRNISSAVFYAMMIYPDDREIIGLIDNLMAGKSEDEIRSFLESVSCDIDNYKSIISNWNFIDVCYNICVRYVPRIRSSANIPADISEFINRQLSLMIHNFSLSDNCFSQIILSFLSSMKRLGLYFTDITEIVGALASCRQKFSENEFYDMIKEYYFPVFGNKLTIRPFHFSDIRYHSKIRIEVLDLLDYIGIERITLDISSESVPTDLYNFDSLPRNGIEHSLSFCRRLVSHGSGFITDEDMITENYSADIITKVPLLLDQLLLLGAFNLTQIEDLIFICSSNKRMEALNVINKFLMNHKAFSDPDA